MAVNDVYRVTANFQGWDGQLLQWVWHYIQTEAGTAATTAILNTIRTVLEAVWADLDAWINSQVIGQTLDLATFDPMLGQWNTVDNVTIAHLVGGTLNPGASFNVAPYVTFFTDLARSRGKKFIFGVTENGLTSGAVEALLLADLATAAAAWVQDIIPNQITMAPGNFNTTTQAFHQWDKATVGVGSYTGSQYRRLPGRGA